MTTSHECHLAVQTALQENLPSTQIIKNSTLSVAYKLKKDHGAACELPAEKEC